MKIGTGIKQVRLQKKLTQQDVADGSGGIAQGYYSLIENNSHKPSLKVLEDICAFLQVPIIVIFWLGAEKKDFKSKTQYEKFKSALDNIVQQELI